MFKPSSKKIYKKLGYAIDQEGILTRFLREEHGWKTHLTNTKNWILNSCNKEYNSIAIIGSGWLLDVPIDELITKFNTIYLIDIIHPKQITHKYRNTPQIIFIETDITGGLVREAYNLIYKSKTFTSNSLHQLQSKQIHLPQVDLVVSLNILNQLDILLIDAFKEHISLNKDDIVKFRKRIQSEHIQLITQNKFCLISDWVQNNTHKKTKRITIKKLVLVKAPKHTQALKWTWNFDSQGFYESEASVDFSVQAYRG